MAVCGCVFCQTITLQVASVKASRPLAHAWGFAGHAIPGLCMHLTKCCVSELVFVKRINKSASLQSSVPSNTCRPSQVHQPLHGLYKCAGQS